MTTSKDRTGNGYFESPDAASAAAIPVAGESVTAFVGPTPRGPVDRPVFITGTTDFDHYFAVPEYHCRMEFAVRQFFANGGERAVVVRISGSDDHTRIDLHGPSGDLHLEARNPGALEFLRASVDYDGIPPDARDRFNLVVQRLRSADSVWIDSQEYFRNVSVDPASRDYVGYVLVQSDLVRLAGVPPAARPCETIRAGTLREAGYVHAVAPHVSCPLPSDYDIIGSTATGTGLNALETLRDIGQVCLISGSATDGVGPVAMLAAERFCRRHHAMLLVDPPSRWESVDDVVADHAQNGFTSANAVTWFPGVRMRNAKGESIVTSACGSVAAAFVEADRTRGLDRLHDSTFLMARGGLQIERELSEENRARLARVGVNSLVRRSALHMQLCSNVTRACHSNLVDGDDDLRLRRDVLLILRRISEGTRWTVYHDSTPAVWRELRLQLDEFLEGLRAASVLVDADAGACWYVKCDESTNPDHALLRNSVSFVVGIALRKPNEFLRFRFRQTPLDCRITELGWQDTMALTG